LSKTKTKINFVKTEYGLIYCAITSLARALFSGAGDEVVEQEQLAAVFGGCIGT
jgi:hypothetical protein